MRSSPLMIAFTAIACALMIGGEATAFAWFLDMMVTGYLHLSPDVFRILALVGIAAGLAVAAWTGVRVYRIEQRLAAEAPAQG